MRRVGVIALVMACGAVIKPPDPDRRLRIETTGTMFDSDRGYRFVVLPEAAAKVVRIDVRYPIGKADDPADKAGLAHLVEHLLFEVEYTVGETRTSIGSELGRLALSSNAHTYAHHTVFETVAAPGAVEAILGLEVNRLAIGCNGLTEEVFAREREVVLNELRERHGATGAALSRVVHEALYPAGHPYRMVGTIESVSQLQLADVCAFLAGPYLRGTPIVVASGAVDVDMVKRAVAKAFVRAGRRQPDPRAKPPRVVLRPGTVRLAVDVDEPAVLVTWSLPPRHTRAYRLLALAWQAIAPRLEWFAFTYQWGHSAHAEVLGGDHAPILAVGISLASASKLSDAIDATEKAVAFAKRVVPDDHESRAWRLFQEIGTERLLARWESLAGRNKLASAMLAYEPRGGFLIGRVDELQRARPGEVRDLIDEWLAPSRARYLLLEPTGGGGASFARTYRGGRFESHGIRVDGALADRPLPLPAPRSPPAFERYTLGNGLTVVLWPHGSLPLVHGRLVIGSGTAHEPRGHEGTATLVGASTVLADHLIFDDRELATDVDAAIEVLASELRVPGYDLTDEDKRYMRGRLVVARAKERASYDHDLMRAVYGADHPYARTTMTEDSLDAIHHDSVMSWARATLVARNATLVLAGRFDPALVRKHVAYNADHVRSGSRGRRLDAAPRPRRAWVQGLTRRAAATVELTVLFPGGRGIDRDHARRLVLEQVLAAELTSLRTREVVTYGFGASYAPRQAGGLWMISGEVDRSRAGDAATALLEILGRLRADPESYRASFVLARQKLVESLLLASTSASAMADRLVELVRFDLPADHHERLAREIASLTLRDFHPFVARELAADRQVFGAFGNAAPVAQAVAAARVVK